MLETAVQVAARARARARRTARPQPTPATFTPTAELAPWMAAALEQLGEQLAPAAPAPPPPPERLAVQGPMPADNKRTVARQALRREVRARGLAVYPDGVERPRLRGDCLEGPRPCPWVGCVHHLYLEVKDNGAITYRFPGLEPHQLTESCSLDVADQGGETMERVGDVLNVTRQRVEQIEKRALEHASAELAELHADGNSAA